MIRRLLPIILATFTLAMAPPEMQEDEGPSAAELFEDAMERSPGLGYSHLIAVNLYYQHGHHFREDVEAGWSTGISVDGAMAFIPTVFGGQFGVEAETGFGAPLTSIFGFFFFQGGAHLRIITLPVLKVSSGLGVGLNSHFFGYVQPRVALNLHYVDLEGTFMWVPEFASHVWGQNGVRERGIGHQRFRGSIFINLDEPNDSKMFTTRKALRLFVEHHRFSGEEELLADEWLRAGNYWGGGIGYAF